jgi:hypothetical protein
LFYLRPVITGAAHGLGRLGLHVAATRHSDMAEERATQFSHAQKMASATVSQGGSGQAPIGPGTANPSGTGGGEGRRLSDTLHRRVQDRPSKEFA